MTIENKEPTTVVNPRITIRHIDDNNVLITDINEATMLLVYGSTYYYIWVIPSSAHIGNHNVEYEAIVDGEVVEYNEVIQIVD